MVLPAVATAAVPAEAPAPPPAVVAVSIDAGDAQARAGGTLSYTVRVRNDSDQPIAAAEVSQMLRPSLEPRTAGQGGQVGATQVTWTADLPPRRDVTLTLTAGVTKNTAHADKLVTTACVRTEPGRPLAGCASSRLAWAQNDDTVRPMATLAAAGTAVVLLAGGGYAVRARRRRAVGAATETD
ncbi:MULTISPECIES: DUF11 domain-containing protein [unclassified Kitasatospora]|uniref:DUF11 domain-containing protein n=1 Tax=unclassified Kitasatospora TaxID=2633591 RepID=UPI00070C1232|nr:MULTISPECIES: DUF11 domain-containing protein [unclassified Kitasatospora]KQV19208.1 hypothetical protein ASC99_23905 [Kitasatospora sp. Root107]